MMDLTTSITGTLRRRLPGSTVGLVATGLLLAMLPLFPVLPSETFLPAMMNVFILGILVISFDLLFGYTGLLSFGHALFFGGPLYVVAILSSQFGFGYFEAIPIAIVATIVVATVVGGISLLTGGISFAMVTLAFAQVGYFAVLRFRGLTGGVQGMFVSLPEPAGIEFTNPVVGYYVALGSLLVVYVSVRTLINSPLGRVFMGIKENEERLEVFGVNTYRFKLLSFVISAVIAAIAGFLYPLFLALVDPSILYWVTTGDVLLMSLIGGVGSIWGPVLGAAFFTFAEDILINITEQWRLFLGVIFVLFVLFQPSGLAGLLMGSASIPNRLRIDTIREYLE